MSIEKVKEANDERAAIENQLERVTREKVSHFMNTVLFESKSIIS